MRNASPVSPPPEGFRDTRALRRSDALRNRAAVLRAAVQLFAEEGPEVPLGRIAQRAGVGAGTVYRHFPSREVLLEAVLAEHVASFVAAADRWSLRARPGDALFGLMLEVIERSAGRKLVCDALAADRSWPHATLGAAVHRFGEALERLLQQAKQAGAIRPDVRTDDLTAVLIGGAALGSAHRDPARGRQLVWTLLDGLRPRVTKHAEFRDGATRPGHETAAPGARRCLECGARLRARATGRPASYCGPTCRQRARRRHARAS